MRARLDRISISLAIIAALSLPPVAFADNDRPCLETIHGKITFYAPGAGGIVEGGFETSRPNVAGRNIPMTLDDVRLGNYRYVTLAANEAHYGKYYYMGTVSYQSPIDGKWYQLNDVVGYVNDTGGAFRASGCARWNTCADIGRKFDVAVGNFTGLSGASASKFVDAQPDGRNALRSMCQIDGPITAMPTSKYLFQGARPEFIPESSSSGGAMSSILRSLGLGASQQPQQGMSVSTGQSAYPTQGAYPSQEAIPNNDIPITGTSGSSGSSGAGGGTPGPAVATMVVHTPVVSRGGTLLISWSSVNMSSIPLCRLSAALPGAEEASVKESNDGSEKIRVPVTTSVGEAAFRLRCVSASGQAVEKTATANIR
jgi:hypothetical protein